MKEQSLLVFQGHRLKLKNKYRDKTFFKTVDMICDDRFMIKVVLVVVPCKRDALITACYI